jgi:methionine aminopeptidase
LSLEVLSRFQAFAFTNAARAAYSAAKHLLMTAYKCLQKGMEQVRPGSRYRDIGEEVTKLATRRRAVCSFERRPLVSPVSCEPMPWLCLVFVQSLFVFVEQTLAAGNCSVVKSYCGHGIGTLFHCAPNIPHYAKNKAVGQMKEGHVFTIEPMINAVGLYKCVYRFTTKVSATRCSMETDQLVQVESSLLPIA